MALAAVVLVLGAAVLVVVLALFEVLGFTLETAMLPGGDGEGDGDEPWSFSFSLIPRTLLSLLFSIRPQCSNTVHQTQKQKRCFLASTENEKLGK